MTTIARTAARVRTADPRRAHATEAAAVGVLGVAVLLAISHLDRTLYSNYVLLAQAFAHGRVWIDWPGRFIDALPYDGKHYIIEGPVPALLLVPFVAIPGAHVNETIFTDIVGGIGLGFAWYLCRRLAAERYQTAVAVAFFAFGTSYAWCAMIGAVWFTAHVVAVAFTFAALAALVDERPAWAVIALGALAAGSRFTLVLALPVYAAVLLLRPGNRVGRAVGIAVVAALAAALFVGYDELRWGVPNDIGFTEWYHQDEVGSPEGSPFQLQYLPYQIHAFFAGFPHVLRRPPFLDLGYESLPLELTSPALLLAFFASPKRPLVPALWIATVLAAGPSFVYYVDGATQFGMRHALDFEPFALVLVLYGVMRTREWFSSALLFWSIGFGFYGLWYWRTYYAALLPHDVRGY